MDDAVDETLTADIPQGGIIAVPNDVSVCRIPDLAPAGFGPAIVQAVLNAAWLGADENDRDADER
jgi:hypothetical protein